VDAAWKHPDIRLTRGQPPSNTTPCNPILVHPLVPNPVAGMILILLPQIHSEL
jgi:hypothetical protein